MCNRAKTFRLRVRRMVADQLLVDQIEGQRVSVVPFQVGPEEQVTVFTGRHLKRQLADLAGGIGVRVYVHRLLREHVAQGERKVRLAA